MPPRKASLHYESTAVSNSLYIFSLSLTFRRKFKILISSVSNFFLKEMEFNQIETRIEEIGSDELQCCENDLDLMSISLEAEVPEALYLGMKDFISTNEKWDQSKLISSAIANFLFQNGSDDRAVTEKYLNDIFNLSS